jgi:hypothetical protein
MNGLDLRTIAHDLREAAGRVERLPAPSARDPEAFHIGRSERGKELRDIARRLWPEPVQTTTGTAATRRSFAPAAGLPRSPRRK